MTTFIDLVLEVEDIVDDATFSRTLIKSKINQGLNAVAGQVLLPGLRTSVEILTTVGTNKTAFAAGFHRDLSRWAHSVTHNRRIKVYGSVPQLFKWFSTIDLAGSVVGVAREGSYLYYQRIPAAAETLMINYFTFPTQLSADDDEPDCLPAHLHSELLVNYACSQIFRRMEDGIEGEAANTQRHKTFYEEALSGLNYFIGPTSDKPAEHQDELFYDDLVNL